MATPARHLSPTQPDITGRYEAQSELLFASVLARLASLWKGLGTWHRQDVASFQKTALPLVAAGQRQMAALTSAYLEQHYQQVFGEPSPRVSLDMSQLTGAPLRNGTSPADEYERPFVQLWTDLSHGEPLDVATESGATRLQQLAETDIQLARTHTAQAVMQQQPRVKYYVRRIESDHPCALCLIASTQRYRKSKLMPIHPACHCITEMVEADYDPGQVINEALLNQIHDAVEKATGQSSRGGRAIDYRKVVVQHDHGEIGPVLGFNGQHFTSRTDIRIPT